MVNPLISILIPAYNVEKYIVECLDSVVNQSYRNLQIVIVDDGSTDGTGEICDKYAESDSRIEVYHIQNGGVANARNVLLSKIKGDFFLFVDSDDFLNTNMLSYLVEIIRKEECDIACCGFTTELRVSDEIIEKSLKNVNTFNQEEIIRKFLYHREINGSLWNKLIKTVLIGNNQFNPAISYGEDALFIWPLIQKIEKACLVDVPVYHHRLHPGSLSHGKFSSKIKSGHNVWNRISSDAASMPDDLRRIAEGNYGVSDFWLLYFAACDGYKEDEDIKNYRNNVKDKLPLIKREKLLDSKKIICAYFLAYLYPVARIVFSSLNK